MYNNQCTSNFVYCASYTMRHTDCTVYRIINLTHSTAYSVQCTPYTVRRT